MSWRQKGLGESIKKNRETEKGSRKIEMKEREPIQISFHEDLRLSVYRKLSRTRLTQKCPTTMRYKNRKAEV